MKWNNRLSYSSSKSRESAAKKIGQFRSGLLTTPKSDPYVGLVDDYLNNRIYTKPGSNKLYTYESLRPSSSIIPTAPELVPYHRPSNKRSIGKHKSTIKCDSMGKKFCLERPDCKWHEYGEYCYSEKDARAAFGNRLVEDVESYNRGTTGAKKPKVNVPSIVLEPINGSNFEQIKSNAQKLYQVYKPGYRLPIWTLNYIVEHPEEYKSLAAKSTVFYDNSDSLQVVHKITTEREPTNIEGESLYNKQTMENSFGWAVGAYNRFFNKSGGSTLPPNIGIYCKVIFDLTSSKSSNQGFPSSTTMLHVYNAIGYAFDSSHQVDYRYFVAGNRTNQITGAYQKMFRKIFKCAEYIGVKTICIPLIGLASFASLYPDKSALMAFWKRALEVEVNNLDSNTIKEISFYGVKPDQFNMFRDAVSKKYICNGYGFLPSILMKPPLNSALNTTLFVNAWDMLSIAGNGNFSDNSLDGFIGRWSNVGYLSWPLTCPKMTYMAVA